LTIIPITGNQETTKPEILKAKQLTWMMSKGTDIDRLKGIFTDYRNAGDFHPTYLEFRQICDSLICCCNIIPVREP